MYRHSRSWKILHISKSRPVVLKDQQEKAQCVADKTDVLSDHESLMDTEESELANLGDSESGTLDLQAQKLLQDILHGSTEYELEQTAEENPEGGEKRLNDTRDVQEQPTLNTWQEADVPNTVAESEDGDSNDDNSVLSENDAGMRNRADVPIRVAESEQEDDDLADADYIPEDGDSSDENDAGMRNRDEDHQNAGDDGGSDDGNNATEREGFQVADTPVKKRKRKGEVDPSSWKQNKNRHLREKGQQYVGNKGNVKGNRSITNRCTCKKTDTRKCADFSDDDRSRVFKEIWDVLEWRQKKIKVRELVDVRPVKQQTNQESRRKSSLFYHLKHNGVRKQVCKKMFLSTTGLKEWSVRTWACIEQPEKLGKLTKESSSYYKRSENGRKYIREEFLEKLQKLPSHYCRSSSSKLYLEPTITNKSDLYQLYKENCNAAGRKPMSRRILIEESDKLKISVFHPRKDQCDTCVSHEAGNLTHEEYDDHRSDVEEARREKESDKQDALLGEHQHRTLVVTMDLQAVLLAPRLKASALYYKTKLGVHNFTIYDLVTRDVTCYVWHEGEGGITANEFATCIVDYLNNHLEYDRYVVYSDGCTYQNRNAILANALNDFAKLASKVVEQKILVKGHTQMEVDSVHSTIERKLKQAKIYCPADYVQIMTTARSKPSPYSVKYVDHAFFKDFSKSITIPSIRPGTKVGDPTVTQLRGIKYVGGNIQYKLKFSDVWTDLPRPRRARQSVPTQGEINPAPPLYDDRRKIQESKYQHLQQLKFVMPSDYHAFYDGLKH